MYRCEYCGNRYSTLPLNKDDQPQCPTCGARQFESPRVQDLPSGYGYFYDPGLARPPESMRLYD